MNKVFFGSTALYLTQFMDLGGQGFMLSRGRVAAVPDRASLRGIRPRPVRRGPRDPEEALRADANPSLSDEDIHLSQVTFMALEDVKFPVPMSQDQTQAR